MPLTDLSTNVRLQSVITAHGIPLASPTNKENVSTPKPSSSSNSSSSIPVRTPLIDPKNSNPLTPKLRRGHLFSKSSTDLSSTTQKLVAIGKPGYMAATTASKIRGTGPEHTFLEPTAPAPTKVDSRFGSNPFK